MNNIVSYIKEEKRTISEYPFNDVDSLILSTIAYFDLTFVPTIKDKKEFFYFRSINNNNNLITDPTYKHQKLNLIKYLKESPRFKNLKMNFYEEKHSIMNETQFCAVTFNLDGLNYICFRGTDDTLTGWKEDFNMAFQYPVPSQKLAVKYVNKVSHKLKGPIYIGGHSKGGNLAIYSALNTNIINKIRIKKIYSHDGPGFKKDIYKSISYKLIAKKISKTIPTSSIVGLLLYTKEQTRIVKSKSFGIFQHASFNWVVHKSKFVYEETTSKDSKIIDNMISNWLNDTDDNKRAIFINTVFSILRYETIHNSQDILKNWYPYYKSIRYKYNKLDDETKQIIEELFQRLITLRKKYNQELKDLKK